MLKKILLSILILSSFIASSQSYSSQKQAANDINEIIKTFGESGTNTITSYLAKDRNDNELFLYTYFTKDRTTVKGKTYRNMKFKVSLKMKNINYVYEDGKKLYFDLNSKGYIMNIKAPRESWIDNRRYPNDFTITINNSKNRKKALKAFKYLVKHPIVYR